MAKRVVACIGILVCLVISAVSPANAVNYNAKGGMQSSKIIVGYDSGGTTAVQVPAGKSAEAMIQYYLSMPGVSYAEEDQSAAVTALAPNDSLYKLQKNTFTNMGITEAWDITGGSGDIIVAVLDTGVDGAHPDLEGRVLDDGYNFVNNSTNTTDDNGHGTMSAGIIAAGVNNGTGLSGATLSCMVLSVKVLDAKGNGYVSNIASGIRYAVDHDADIINLSLGCNNYSQTLQDAVTYAWENDVIVIAATGNTGSSIQYPAACNHAVAVGAITKSNTIASYSNYGEQQALVAVGSGVYSTTLESGYSVGSGTSFATPFVSSLAALLLSVNPDYTPDELATIMEETAVDLGDPGWDQHYGYGCVNFNAALQSIIIDDTAADELEAGETEAEKEDAAPDDGTDQLQPDIQETSQAG